MVGERSRVKKYDRKDIGATRSDNAGVSNEKRGRILSVENPSILGEGSSALCKSGPKVSPEGVADGYQVENPELVYRQKE